MNQPPAGPEQPPDTHQLRRRGVLAGAGAALTASLAGCLGSGVFGSTGAHDGVVLEEPDNYDLLDGSELEHPIHGEEFPDVTVPDVVSGREVATREFVGDRHVLLTFVFTRCPGACPALTSNLLQVQADAAENGYTDEVALLECTFDPEYDTEERFHEYAEQMGIDLDAGNWYFLRPESKAYTTDVVTDTFGVWYEELTDQQREEMEMPEDMAFQHENLILLVNEDGYVERAYSGEPPTPATVIDDVHTLRERW